MDRLTSDAFEQRLEDLLDEVESAELQLQKCQIQFELRDKDQAYYKELIKSTNQQIEQSKQEMEHLQQELESAQRTKACKAQFEEVSRLIE